MKIDNINNYSFGDNAKWLVGIFENSLVKTDQCEVGIHYHLQGEKSQSHYHTNSTEYNVVLDGIVEANGHFFHKGDVFIYDSNEVNDVKFHTDCSLLVIRNKSLPNGDKVMI